MGQETPTGICKALDLSSVRRRILNVNISTPKSSLYKDLAICTNYKLKNKDNPCQLPTKKATTVSTQQGSKLDVDRLAINDTINHPAKISQDGADGTGRRPQIYILGDQQVKNLASSMRQYRTNKWNDIYEVRSFIKPDADSQEIVGNCEGIKNSLKSGDIVVLSVGSNDRNLT